MKAKSAQSSATAAEREFLLWYTFTDPKLRLPMKSTQLEPKHQPTEAEIRHAAYLLWVEDGRPEGRDLQHRQTARAMLTHRRPAGVTPRGPELSHSLRH